MWRTTAIALVLLTAACSTAPAGDARPAVGQVRPRHTPVTARPETPTHTGHRPETTPRSAPRPTRTARRVRGAALLALARISVKGRAPMTGYDRDRFGSAWTDDNRDPFGHNGCDTRNDVLRRDLLHPGIEAGTNGCVVLTGLLRDPYTARSISFQRGEATSSQVQIDHVVALGDAWQTGAQQWSAATRQDFANDPLNLLAVDGPANEAKGDSDAASWLPPNRAFRCSYVSRQAAVKAKYGLWMTSAEKAATRRILAGCGRLRLPVEPGRLHPPSASSLTAGPPPARPTTRHTGSGGGCEPGYQPCLPVTGDLDCADIADSLKPIHVSGADPYRLDADGDGLGCES